MKNLAQLKNGASSQIENLGANDVLAQRLMALGIFPGSSVGVRQTVPFGGPLLCQFSLGNLGIRRTDASNIVLNHESRQEMKRAS